MKVTYDPTADALYLTFASDKKSTNTVEVRDDLLVDYNNREMIGIEILNVSKKLPKKDLGTITVSVPQSTRASLAS